MEIELLQHTTRSYREICMLQEPLTYAQKALDIYERLHGDADHADTVQCIKSYAVGLGRTGRDNEAVPLYKRALDMCERLHGDTDHPDTVDCMSTCAVCLSRIGMDNESLLCMERLNKMHKRFGDI